MTRGRPEKVREDRLRQVAARQGLVLSKSPRRDVRALDYGRFYMTRDGIVISDGARGQWFPCQLERHRGSAQREESLK
jgi:hypothetical protein